MAAAVLSSGVMAVAAARSVLVTSASAARSRTSAKLGMRRLKNFGGLKPESTVSRLGVSKTTEEAFAGVRASCSARGVGSQGGSLAANCDVASEIFTVIPIMSGLTLLGIALGFVLLRVEAAVEESE